MAGEADQRDMRLWSRPQLTPTGTDIIHNIIYDTVYDIAYNIVYKQFTFPLDAAKRVQMAMGTTNNITSEDSI